MRCIAPNESAAHRPIMHRLCDSIESVGREQRIRVDEKEDRTKRAAGSEIQLMRALSPRTGDHPRACALSDCAGFIRALRIDHDDLEGHRGRTN